MRHRVTLVLYTQDIIACTGRFGLVAIMINVKETPSGPP